jgi:hypothetical protein
MVPVNPAQILEVIKYVKEAHSRTAEEGRKVRLLLAPYRSPSPF